MNRLDEKLAALKEMPPAQLRNEWQRSFGERAPSTFGPDLLALGIAHRSQERAFGGLPRAAARQLSRITAGSEEAMAAPALHPGTRLARDWNGHTHHVLATDTGFRYRDRDYRSLTAIAREITGAGWSGPRFFGLTAKRCARG